MFGKVFETVRSGRFIQFLVQDPDPGSIEMVRDMPGVTEFEDVPVSLEEVYAAVIGKPSDAAPRPPQLVPESANGVAHGEGVRS
jgi:ABC-2 type transport system ATP-binding protein